MKTSENDWTPNGLTVWTTDFGLENGFVGTMRGVVLGRVPASRHVDLTHAVPPQAVEVAALELRHALPYFPAGSLHVVVVDPGVGTTRGVLCGVAHGQCVLGPDNGLIPLALPPTASLYRMDPERFALPEVSSTFHGRDVFAPLAAALLRGEQGLTADRRCSDPVTLATSQPEPIEAEGRRGWRLRVLLVDRFGNLVTNGEGELVAGLQAAGAPADAWVQAAGQRLPVQKTYAEVRPGEALALLNSWGHLEIAVRDGHASRQLGLHRGATVELWQRT